MTTTMTTTMTTQEPFDCSAIIIKVLASAGQQPQAYAVAVSDLTLVTEHTDFKQDDVLVTPPALLHNTDISYVASKKDLVPLTKDDINTRLRAAIEADNARAFYYQVYLTKNKKLSWPGGDCMETALHSAVMMGNKYIFETVLKRMSDEGILESADPGANNCGGNVLHYIATFGQTELVRSLIAIKPDLMQQLASADREERNQPLFIALLKHNFELASLLLEYTVHDHIKTLLVSAVNEESMRLVELLTGSEPVTVHEGIVMRKLLSYGSFLESTNWNGLNALHVAVGGNPVIFELVYKAYAAANLLLSKSAGYGHTLLFYVIGTGNSKAVIELLDRPDLDPKIMFMPNSKGNTPLFWAAERGMGDVFKRLYALTETDDLLKQNSNGETVLVSAIRGKNAEILNTLLNHPDVGSKLLDTDDNDSCSPLVFAVQSSNLEACQVLYDRMDLRQICKQTKPCGRGAMHWAFAYRSISMADLLSGDSVKSHALLLVKNAEGKTPYQC